MRKCTIMIAITILCLFTGFGMASAKDTFKVGALVPITGTQAVMAEDLATGFKLAVEEINAAGGVLGKPIEVIIEDTETRPAPGMDAARKLIDVDQVKVIAGGFSSGVSLPIAKYAQSKGVLFVLGAPTSPLFEEVGDYIFMSYVLDRFKGKAIAD